MAERCRRAGTARALSFAATLLAAACRTTAPPAVAAPPALSGLGAIDLATQHLYHVQGRRDGADLRFRLALRIWSAQVFDLAASDPFGRPLWRLVVTAGAGEWRDLRAPRACRFDPASPIRMPGFAVPYAASELPLLLLGRLPLARPEVGARAHRVGDEIHLQLANPPIELQWRETAGAPLAPSVSPPSAPPDDLPLCIDADFS